MVVPGLSELAGLIEGGHAGSSDADLGFGQQTKIANHLAAMTPTVNQAGLTLAVVRRAPLVPQSRS